MESEPYIYRTQNIVITFVHTRLQNREATTSAPWFIKVTSFSTHYLLCFNHLPPAYICFIFLRALTFEVFTKPNQTNHPYTNDITVNGTINPSFSRLKIQKIDLQAKVIDYLDPHSELSIFHREVDPVK
ncbi:hypothetical protein VCR26J2_170092 [Vibrio coralliirubri]|nr:hypothetical protein VCR1J2_190094 [Vibrio coralliirubri]CDT47902.1 hypothetical protein VCR26J2_170092 [Vibrio coralliirubri]CDU08897.1 hypothetical protein VCR8J2_50111 [Vibrio coralliirubri]